MFLIKDPLKIRHAFGSLKNKSLFQLHCNMYKGLLLNHYILSS